MAAGNAESAANGVTCVRYIIVRYNLLCYFELSFGIPKLHLPNFATPLTLAHVSRWVLP